jgi:hypothetical protein
MTTATLPEISEVTIARAAILLRRYIAKKKSTMLWGPPGIGKSAIVYQIAAGLDWKVIDFRANIREPVDVRGIPVPDLKTGTTRWLTPDELPRVERDGEHGILFLDEINTASPQMMAVLFQLIWERKVGDYTLPDGWVIVAAGNRVSDRAAAQRMPTALRNRFAHIYVTVDVKAWCDWANANSVAPELVAFIRLRGKDVLHVMPRGDENAFPTPRSLTDSAEYVNEPKDVRLSLFAGCIGEGTAAEFDGFIELYRSFGSLEDIIADPKGAPVPTEPSARYAVCTGVARLANRKNLPAIIEYAKRLPRENQILVVHDATTRDPSLKETTAYGKWAVDNQDIILQMS